ncbi:MAG: prepilin-type N-terminal cleavage/methylation domain-containing protein [candidate division Zixibacteria bacterium]|nr:prepilin-type N-terminal cleavage/methylation domain-containing protein [candidate division Zixibacteria bacterium]
MIERLEMTRGFTLIEFIIVIMVVGVLATVAVRKIGTSLETAKYEHTKKELNALAAAIVGNPGLYSSGARTDFGYVGDIGAMPPNLDALVTSPGGFATWDGPYINRGVDLSGFKQDAWNVAYTFIDTLLRSSGSGINIDKIIANSTAALLSNSVKGTVTDADRDLPGTTYSDSLVVRLTFPDGSGSMTTTSVNPDAKGCFSFSGVPIGNQTLSVIYIPDTDTVSYQVCVSPARVIKMDLVFPADLW